MDAETGFARYRQLYAQGADVERLEAKAAKLYARKQRYGDAL